jgi:hypothetical protein
MNWKRLGERVVYFNTNWSQQRREWPMQPIAGVITNVHGKDRVDLTILPDTSRYPCLLYTSDAADDM